MCDETAYEYAHLYVILVYNCTKPPWRYDVDVTITTTTTCTQDSKNRNRNTIKSAAAMAPVLQTHAITRRTLARAYRANLHYACAHVTAKHSTVEAGHDITSPGPTTASFTRIVTTDLQATVRTWRCSCWTCIECTACAKAAQELALAQSPLCARATQRFLRGPSPAPLPPRAGTLHYIRACPAP